MALAPGVDLGQQRRDGQVGQAVEQLAPQRRVAVHHRLGLPVGARRPALDQVAGDGERCAGEADERRGAELVDHEADGLGDVGRVGLGLEGRSRSRSALERNGSLDDGPDAGVTSTPKPMAAAGTTMSV